MRAETFTYIKPSSQLGQCSCFPQRTWSLNMNQLLETLTRSHGPIAKHTKFQCTDEAFGDPHMHQRQVAHCHPSLPSQRMPKQHLQVENKEIQFPNLNHGTHVNANAKSSMKFEKLNS
jgi:hypothetical protein